MNPLLAAAAFSTTARSNRRRDEDAFYDLHGGRIFRRAAPAAPAVAVAVALVVLTGLFGGA